MPHDFYREIKRYYNFDQGPTQNPSGTNQFHFGRFGDISIEQINLTSIDQRATSIGVLTKMSTDDGIAVSDDLLKWAANTYKLDIKEIEPVFYHSQVEVTFDGSFAKLAGLQILGARVSDFLRQYGFKEGPTYDLSGFSLHLDTVGYLGPVPTPFTLERRVGARFDENKFFSQAPLQTKDHERILGELESLLR
jgi:hypothetical protein